MMQYQALLGHILQYGTVKGDRTGTGTKSIFGHQMRFDLTESFPLVTTKRVFWKGVVEELLWMLRGDTNVRSLQEKGVTIWDEWADANGDLGPVYGRQWRAWEGLKPAKFTPGPGAVTLENLDRLGTPVCIRQPIDQIQDAIDQLKTNPDSRRIIVSAWNPAQIAEMALAPCHCLFQFNTRPMTFAQRLHIAANGHSDNVPWTEEARAVRGDVMSVQRELFRETPERAAWLDEMGAPTRYLDCRLDQRSADVFLGVPFNIASYALLTHMMAQVVGMVPGDFIWQGGDVHLYSNHFEQAREQLDRETRRPPQVRLNPDVKDLFAFTAEDITLVGYDPHPPIKAEVSV